MSDRMRSSCRTVLAAAVLLAAPVAASAQLLDDVWFKVRASVTGLSVDGQGTIVKDKAIRTAYLHFTPTVVAPTDAGGPPIEYYQVDVVTEVAPGSFAVTSSSVAGLIGPSEELSVSLSLVFHLGDGTDDPYFAGSPPVAFDIRLDAAGHFKKATLRSLGGQVIDASLDGVTGFVGDLKLTGASVAPDKLPFPAS